MHNVLTAFCLTAAAVLLAASIFVRIWECRHVVLARDRRRHHSLGERIFICFLVAMAAHYGATKNSGGDDSSAPSDPPLTAGLPQFYPIAVDDESAQWGMPDGFVASNLCFWGILATPTSVRFGVSWPVGMVTGNSRLDVFCNSRLATNGWLRIAEVFPLAALSNLVVEVDNNAILEASGEDSAFFRMASGEDSDGDGLTDAEERWGFGTNPESLDSDGDGIDDALEVALGLNPANPDTDGDGANDGDELFQLGTDPLNPDSDNDGHLDGEEVETGFDPLMGGEYREPELSPDANPASYCYVDIVSDVDEAEIVFSGIGSSDLEDPRFRTHAFETNHVKILIGKHYCITSSVPLRCVGKSHDEIVVSTNDECSLSVVWPVVIETIEFGGGGVPLLMATLSVGRNFGLAITPTNVAGTVSWSNSCCPIQQLGLLTYSQTCAGCGCGGCAIHGKLHYEGLQLDVDGGMCGCDHPDDGEDPESSAENPRLPTTGGVHLSFSPQAIIYEDEYEDSSGTGDMVPLRSTQAVLTCTLFGGEHGGEYSIIFENKNKLQHVGMPAGLPTSGILAPGEEQEYAITYKGVEFSDFENDVVVRASFSDAQDRSLVYSSSAKLTVVQVKFRPEKRAYGNDYKWRHKLGVNEKLGCVKLPPEIGVEYVCRAGSASENDEYICPLEAVDDPLTVKFGGTEYSPHLSVVEPARIFASNIVVRAYNVSSNQAGGVGMTMQLYVEPFDVWFGGIAMEEVPCTEATVSGYFANPVFVEFAAGHTRAHGAGRWSNVNGDNNNCWATDCAAIIGVLPRMTEGGTPTEDLTCGWSDGESRWKIPFGWNILNTTGMDTEYKQLHVIYEHVCTMCTNGRASVSKFGYTVSRDITGEFYINGQPIEEGEVYNEY